MTENNREKRAKRAVIKYVGFHNIESVFDCPHCGWDHIGVARKMDIRFQCPRCFGVIIAEHDYKSVNETMDVAKIVRGHLKDHEYDGLYCETADCACEIDDLFPCCEYVLKCKPGYKVIPPKGIDGKPDFYICKDRNSKPWED